MDDSEPSIPIVGIGASAGGLEALREMVSSVQGRCGMAFVVVQHLDPNHESMLAQLLDRHTALDVLQCEGGEKLEAENVYIIPPGHGLAVKDGHLQLTEFEQPRGLRRPIDDFFISLAQDQEANAACVILSGTGADGTTGLRAIKEHGGVCVVQEPDTARYDGMPLSAVATGLVDFVKEPAAIVDCLSGFFARVIEGGADEAEAEVVADHVDELCKVLRDATGHDFSGYKRSTLVRRIERRMNVLNIETGRAYLSRVKTDEAECHALLRDLLINVTRFFRDAEAFEVLRKEVIEKLVDDAPKGRELRIWVPGCSSGEEAYSIAMLFAEAVRQSEKSINVQVFATDIDERMLDIARGGTYPSAALGDIPYALRERYTTPHTDRFTIATAIRDMVRFSNHSVVKDPPFSRVDLVSCRNLLIYFGDKLQQSVLPLLHYAIRPEGFLFLGPSESVGRFESLFPPVDQQSRIFQRAPGAPKYPIDLPSGLSQRSEKSSRSGDSGRRNMQEDVATRRLVERYAPPSMVLDQEGSIIEAYGRLARYFEFPVTRVGGSSAITLARPGLRNALGRLLRECRSSGKRVVARDVEVVSEFGMQRVDAICDPLADRTFLLVLRDSAPFETDFEPDAHEIRDADQDADALEDELRVTRHRLRSTVEELETANEELKSSNEEMMSMNEELQSTNEELSTVNDELKNKIDQLTIANSDLRNFFDSTELAVVVLDANLNIRSYTEAAKPVFPFQPGDRGRPLADVSTRLDTDSYLADARSVANGGPAVHHRVNLRDGDRTYSLKIVPYQTQKGETEGAILMLTDITDALSLERKLERERERLSMAIHAGGIGIWEYHVDTGETVLDDAERRILGLSSDTPHDIQWQLNRVFDEDRPAVEASLRKAVAGEGDFEASFRVQTQYGETRYIKGFGRLVADSDPRRIVGMSIDVTPENTLAETRALMLREMNHRVKNLFAIIGGMISAGARSHDDVREFANEMRERIAGLGRAHSLASTDADVPAIGLDTLIETTLEPYRDHAQIDISGPDVAVERQHLSPMALLLHEWATNAVKYGSLRNGDGRLDISWAAEDGEIRLVWNEKNAEPIPEPPRSGFGSLLVETSARQLGAKVERKVMDCELRLALHIPAEKFAHG
ncbi:chemotaxis protein CheB [Stakelama marina]|uniref:PAS domain-containing protein n=1 Tax=Stakelama marina TaxID=2826939 RepID=A0A8T4IHT5_9SPHN|nr:chemotaxis protein CheB [Stakelama marina]MBR0551766.1 PAS domain-containing protein [Stakelama marina]